MLNVLMLGIGQCGNRILDAVNREAFGGSSRLSKYYSRQKFPSRVETLAINTAVNDLKELRFTAAKDRLHVPNLHGVGANRGIGKQGFWENREMIMEEIERRGDFDIAFVMTSASGGTGSSFTPLVVHELRERYKKITVIPVMVLPFREEGSIYLQNAAFSMRDIMEVESDGIILVDNQYLKRLSGDIKTAYDKINEMVAERLLFLIESLDSEMLSVTDLGDFKTVMKGGLGMGTLGFYESDKKTASLTSAIESSLKPSGLLYPADVYEDAARAMIIIQGSRDSLDVDEITKSVEKLSTKIGQVFKGIVIKKGRPKILSVFTLGQVPDLEMLYAQAAQAIQDEKSRKTRAKKQLDDAFAYIEDLEEVY
ncbi:cell division protein FtsZ [Methanothrix harundinacea]|uniref:cell division protein FtsZ n=1 Tax=Methanothrix harundinacea TaxID=301375 RepID=UPI00064FA540|nr:cell division protein FtsZ [Methanothrix harundinacea]